MSIYKLFLSHDHRDSGVAKAFAQTLSRITLGQIDVWFSSDSSSTGGMQPGIWIDQVRKNISESKAVLPLLTPRSVSRPWLLFETGCGAFRTDCKVIPISIGIDSLSDIPSPLAIYQVFEINEYSSFRDAVAKIISLYEIKFDEEMARPILEKAISEIVQKFSSDKSLDIHPKRSIGDQVEDIKNYIDKRLFKFETTLTKSKFSEEQSLPEYSIPIELRFSKIQSIQYVKITNNTSVQDVLDDIYYMLEVEVNAFEYLQTWIMRETQSGRHLVIREVAHLIPAKYVLSQGSKWEVIPLKQPYSGVDSRDHERWYFS